MRCGKNSVCHPRKIFFGKISVASFCKENFVWDLCGIASMDYSCLKCGEVQAGLFRLLSVLDF